MEFRTTNQTISRENSIGEILLNSKKITEFDIEKIVAAQKANGLYFGETLVKMGLASKEDVELAIAHQFSHPYLSKNQNTISKDVIAAYTPFTPQVEAIRNIRTALLLAGVGQQGLKSICLASYKAGEGKTFIGTNLAVLFAQLGQKTLLMDFNLRTPTIHKLFKLKNSKGISTLLINRSTLEETIHHTAFKKLNVLPSGPQPPNPLELISRKEARQLMETLKKSYEVIIVNTPCVERGVDASYLASFMDGVCIVVSQGQTRKDELEKIKQLLEGDGTRLLGVVLTQK